MTAYCATIGSVDKTQYKLTSTSLKKEHDGRVYRILTYTRHSDSECEARIKSCAEDSLEQVTSTSYSNESMKETKSVRILLDSFETLRDRCETIEFLTTTTLPAKVNELLLQEPSPENIDQLDRYLRMRDITVFWEKVGIASGICVKCEVGQLEQTVEDLEQQLQDWCFKNRELLEQVTELSLNNLNLTHLPPQIGELINLTQLNLSSNTLSCIPEELLSLTKLIELDISANKLNELSPEINKLKSLTSLLLGFNKLEQLPLTICELNQLETLNLIDNLLIELPDEIGDMQALVALNLKNNLLETLPSQISKLINLAELAVTYNPLELLPENITHLTNLKELSLEQTLLEKNQDIIDILKNNGCRVSAVEDISYYSDEEEF